MEEKEYNDKVIVAIGAHPDDIEFACGATMAKLASLGAKLIFVVVTDGQRGSRQHKHDDGKLVKLRNQESHDAAKILGAKDLLFLDQPDGNLEANLAFKEKIVKIIRKYKPDMVFTHDPSWYYRIGEQGAFVNHNDHRQTGIAVLDAVYPLARDLASFPEHVDEGLEPHKVLNLYLFHSENSNSEFDVTGFEETKIAGILAHKSQIDDPEAIRERTLKRLSDNGDGQGKMVEKFIHLQFN